MLENTGERMIPESTPGLDFWNHLFRYEFAAKQVAGLRVLDIASGEGYGTSALAKVASSVVGVDISPEAVDHATMRYRLDFRLGDAEKIPLENASVDAVVSFETIEHVASAGRFMDEIRRVLKPGGLVVISTPNPAKYLAGKLPNPFHIHELSQEEFFTAVSERFELTGCYGQQFERTPASVLKAALSPLSNTLAHAVADGFLPAMLRPFMGKTWSDSPGVRGAVLSAMPNVSGILTHRCHPCRIRPIRREEPTSATFLIVTARLKA